MFVRKSTYDRVCEERDSARSSHMMAQTLAYAWQTRHSRLLEEWNNLVARINSHGGEELFRRATDKQTQLSDEDIKKLLQLCHPDKHDGKQLAVDMTAKLLQLRK